MSVSTARIVVWILMSSFAMAVYFRTVFGIQMMKKYKEKIDKDPTAGRFVRIFRYLNPIERVYLIVLRLMILGTFSGTYIIVYLSRS